MLFLQLRWSLKPIGLLKILLQRITSRSMKSTNKLSMKLKLAIENSEVT